MSLTFCDSLNDSQIVHSPIKRLVGDQMKYDMGLRKIRMARYKEIARFHAAIVAVVVVIGGRRGSHRIGRRPIFRFVEHRLDGSELFVDLMYPRNNASL